MSDEPFFLLFFFDMLIVVGSLALLAIVVVFIHQHIQALMLLRRLRFSLRHSRKLLEAYRIQLLGGTDERIWQARLVRHRHTSRVRGSHTRRPGP